MAQLFKDSKTFVDLKMLNEESVTLESFNKFMAETKNLPTIPELRQWVTENFEEPGSEFEEWTPPDHTETPAFLQNIKDERYKQWGQELNTIWLDLGRKLRDEVRENIQYYSIIPVPNPVIVPGGRFLEYYYWDSYWVIRGLLLSEMKKTVKGMLENFLDLLATFEYIPNGGRVYYSKRTQPPLLSGMIKSYLDATNDTSILTTMNVRLLRDEFDYFTKTRPGVQVNGHTLYQYTDSSYGPRPESYREDFESSKNLQSTQDREDFYSEMKAGAESGMDFTSRWFIGENNTNEGTLTDIKTKSIIPVDLNAILYWNAKLIAEYYRKIGNTAQAQRFETEAANLLEAIEAVLWSEEDGAWYDYDILNSKPRKYFSASNLSPLWVKAYKNETYIADKVLAYITSNKLDQYAGGVPNTFAQTGQQWDYPNVWAPLQHMLIIGLDNLNNQMAKDLAFKWAEKWVKNNYIAYKQNNDTMFEKYHAVNPGQVTGGGEYEVQTGFGWSNGVIMELLNKYGDRLVSEGKLYKI